MLSCALMHLPSQREHWPLSFGLFNLLGWTAWFRAAGAAGDGARRSFRPCPALFSGGWHPTR